jgi:tetratricopeptide (TPR) repeat protein
MRSIDGTVPTASAADPGAGAQPATGDAAGAQALRVSVVNGNLLFLQEPLLLGHYRDAALAGVESIVDELMSGALSASLLLGRYPHRVGSQQVFVNAGRRLTFPFELPRPAGVIVVGLGSEGQLRASDLVTTVRLGVISWAQHLMETVKDSIPPFPLAATLIGSGGTGIAAGQSARLVVEGVCEANLRLAKAGWPCVSQLRLIELFMDRSTEAWRSLHMMDQANPGRFVLDDAVARSTGGLSRPLDNTYRGADYDLFSALSREDASGETSIIYTLDTRRARTEVRATATQGRLLRQLVKTASNADNRDPQIGRTLFQLLVPREMHPFLSGGSEMQIEVDGGTAGIPWELLDNTVSDPSQPRTTDSRRPWAIRARLLRKLRTNDFRGRVDDATREAQILVIGEPYCDNPRFPRLPGARAEGEAVARMLAAQLGAAQVRALVAMSDSEVGADARTIVSALLERDWRVLHICGHGEPPAEDASKPATGDRLRGVVLSDGIYLGPREIGLLQQTPELVFINCCHLAERSADQLLKDSASQYDRPNFAATVAEELIKIGVKCVIAAGWAVDDVPAQTFATVFYDRLLNGDRFLDAVATARDSAWLAGGNTWAAYQCYGDPNWVLGTAAGPFGASRRSPAERYSGVSSDVMLVLALEEFETNALYNASYPTLSLEYLDATFGAKWGRLGNVAEAFGKAWSAAGQDQKAIAWFDKALAANDGHASFRSSDQLANLRARLAWGTLKTQATRSADGLQASDVALDAARAEILESIRRLEAVLEVQETSERLSLCAASYKRLAFVERMGNRLTNEATALDSMASRYARAEKLANAQNEATTYYPMMNRLVSELVANLRHGAAGYSNADVDALCAMIDASCKDHPDFWCIVARIELQFYHSVKAGQLADDVETILDALRNLKQRISSKLNWSSVLDQCDFVLAAYTSREISQQEKDAGAKLLQTLDAWVQQT